MQALLAAPDRSTPAGRRDHSLLLFLYNPAARVHEITHVPAADLNLVRPPQILRRGKGKKERICPLWISTAAALRALLDEEGISPASDRRVFLNAQGEPLTRFGVDYILKKYASMASSAVPSILRKRVSPHIIRHTCAVHMLNAGVDINVVRSWLGHVDLRTTNIYTEIDLSTKRKVH